jgi:hypothetical protein
LTEGEIIEISHSSVIPDNSHGIPIKFYANFQGIPKIIPNNSKESQRIPKIDRSVIPTIIFPLILKVLNPFEKPGGNSLTRGVSLP